MNPQKVLWFAMFASSLVYVAVAYTLAPAPEHSFEESLRGGVTLILYAIAFMMFVAGLIVPNLMQAPARLKMIVALALFEACSIFGLVAAILQHDWRLVLPAWMLALAGFVRAFPKDEQVAA